MKNKTTKTMKDGFVYLLVTGKAKEIYTSGLFELFGLYDDDSESLIESHEQLTEAMEQGLDIGISVGYKEGIN